MPSLPTCWRTWRSTDGVTMPRSHSLCIRVCSWGFCLLVGAGFLTNNRAWANGRFPAAGQIALVPGEASRIVARTTYGLVVTQDGGVSWRWVCEAAVGYDGAEDPFIAVLGGGRIVAATEKGLVSSGDGGCVWARPFGPTGTFPAVDLVRDATNTVRSVALSTEVSETAAVHRLVETLDAGKTWQPLGKPLPEGFLGQTLEMAASDPKRYYVSGLVDTTGFLQRSDDGGETWQTWPLPLGKATGGFLSAVHPTDKDRLWLRLDHEIKDQLLTSTDGGKTWQLVFEAPGALFGFALSPDGSEIALGVLPPKPGLWRGSTANHAFVQVNKAGARCLTWTPEGLFACGSQGIDGFTVARSQDGGKTLQTLLHETDLQALACGPKTKTGNVCPGYWPSLKLQLGIDKPTVPKEPVVPPVVVDEGCGAGRTQHGFLSLLLAGLAAVVSLGIARRRS